MTDNTPADGDHKRSGRLTDGSSTNQGPGFPSHDWMPRITRHEKTDPFSQATDLHRVAEPRMEAGPQVPSDHPIDWSKVEFPDADPNDGHHLEYVPDHNRVEWVKDLPPAMSPGPQMPSDHPVDWSKVKFPGPDGYSGGHNVWNPVTKQVDWVRDPITREPPTDPVPVPGGHPEQPVDWTKAQIPDTNPDDGIHQEWVPEHGQVEWVKDLPPGMSPGPQMPSDHPVDWSKVKFPDTDPNDGHHLEYVPEDNRVEWVKDKPPGEVKTEQPDHQPPPGDGDTQHPVSHHRPHEGTDPSVQHDPNGGVDQVVHQPPQVLTPDKPGLAWVADHGQWKLKWLGDPKKAPLLDNGPYELRVGKDGELQTVYNARDKHEPVRDFDPQHHGHHGGHGDDKSGLMVGPDGEVHWVGKLDKAPFVDNGKIHIGPDGKIEFDGVDAKTGGLSRTESDGKVLNTDPSAGGPPEGFHGQHRYGMLPDEQDTKIAARTERGKTLGKDDDAPGKDGGGSGKPHDGDPDQPPGNSQNQHVKSERPGDGGSGKPFTFHGGDNGGGNSGNSGKDGGNGGDHYGGGHSNSKPFTFTSPGGGDGQHKGGDGKSDNRPFDPTSSTVHYKPPADGKNGDGKGGDGKGGDSGGPTAQGITITSRAPGNGGNSGGDGKNGTGDKKNGDGGKKDDDGGKKDGDGDKGGGDKNKKPKPLPPVKDSGGSGNLRFNKEDWNKLLNAFTWMDLSLTEDATMTKDGDVLDGELKLQPQSKWAPATELNKLGADFGGSVVKVNDDFRGRIEKFVDALVEATDVFEKTDDLANYSLNEFVTEFPDLNAGGGKMGGDSGGKGA